MSYREGPAPADLAGQLDRVWTRQPAADPAAVPVTLPYPQVDLLVLPSGTILLAGPELRSRALGELVERLPGHWVLPGAAMVTSTTPVGVDVLELGLGWNGRSRPSNRAAADR